MDYAVLKKNFENHRFHTSYFETKEEAAAYLSDQIKGEKVGFGGSITAKEMNLFEILGKDNEVIWHWEQGPDARIKAKDSTVYILSAPAAAATGPWAACPLWSGRRCLLEAGFRLLPLLFHGQNE